MKQQKPHQPIAIVLTEHPVFGVLLVPYVTEEQSDGTIHLIEQAFHTASENPDTLDGAEQKAIQIASHYTEKYLMGVYSKEKIVSRFLRKLPEEPERLTQIRLFIEKKLLEMLALIRHHHLSVYQKQAGSKIVYPHNAYQVHTQEVETRFHFNVSSTTFSYCLKCYYNQQPLSLTDHKPVIVLTANPATLVLGMNIYMFRHIESTRLLPFTRKTSISVNTEQIEKYINNIVIPIARYHEITAEGLDMTEKPRPCKAVLYLEETVYDDMLLRLSFEYGDQQFTPDSSTEIRRIISRKKSGGLSYFQRDRETENRALALLDAAGLIRIDEVHFKLPKEAPESNLTEWIDRHRTMLQESFQLTSDLSKAPFCLDEINIEQSCENGPDWFELHITVLIGGLRIPFSRFRRHILEEKREYILPDGRIVLLPEEWFSKYTNLLEIGEHTEEQRIRLGHSYVGIIQSILGESDLNRLPYHHTIGDSPSPAGLKAQLRPYQQKGFSWLRFLYEQHFGGCLADDMGLGKTLQTLTLLQSIYKPRPSEPDLFQEEFATEEVAAATEEREATDESGQLSLFTEKTELLPTLDRLRESTAAPTEPRRPATLIVMPTSLLHNWKREAKRFTTLSVLEYNSAIYFREREIEQLFNRYHLVFTSYGMMRNNVRMLRSYRFEYVILDESQNIKNSDSLTFRSAIQLQCNHRLVLTGTPIENSLKDLWAQFRFIQPDLLGDESDFQKQFITPIRQEDQRTEKRLRQLIAPFLLRRSKQEVAPELPSLTEEIIHCEMTEEQAVLYQQEKNSLRNILLQQHNNAPHFQPLTVLNGILRLRQLSCDPRLAFPHSTAPSGKMEQIIETFQTLRSEGHKVLIFSSFVKHLELLAETFRERGWKYALLTGNTTDRPAEIARFAEGDDVQAFLISLKAGGVGLNLTQADYVFIIDPWWNPSAEAQAIARAHRIGQERQVIAYRFITQESIEEKIIDLQNDKQKLADTFINDTDSLPALTGEEWMKLL